MTHSRQPIVAGNWKMHGKLASLGEIDAIREALKKGEAGRAQLVLCLPATLINAGAEHAKGSSLAIGAQDCHWNASGAHTGDLSPAMLADAGASYIIVGHSERRQDHGEDDAMVKRKAAAVLAAGACAIICVGETRAQRDAGGAFDIVAGQIDHSLPEGDADKINLAYEPVWAIGTGLTPTPRDVEAMHQHIRAVLKKKIGAAAEKIHILYGGSVKPDNAAQLMSRKDVDGALVGGASLKARDFLAIAAAYH